MSRASRASEVVPRLRRWGRSPQHGGMSSRLSSLFLSALAWVGFVVVVLWTIGFLAGVVVPRTVDGPARTTTGFAVAADLASWGCSRCSTP